MAKKANFRYIIAPTTKLETGYIPFNFDPEEIEHNIQAGIRDATAAIEAGEGKTFKDIISYATEKSRDKTRLDYGDWLEAQE